MSTGTERPYAERLRRVTPDAASATRLLCDARYVDVLRRLGTLDALEISSTGTNDHAFVEPGRIVFAHLEGTLNVNLDLANYPALQIVAASAGNSARHTLRNTLANSLLAPLVQRFQEAGLGRWRVTSVERSQFGNADIQRFDVALLYDGNLHRIAIDAPRSTLDALHKRFGEIPSRSTTASFSVASPLLIPGAIALGARNVPVAALQSLRPGDVLLRAFSPAVARALRDGIAFSARASWGANAGGMRGIHARINVNDMRATVEENPIMNEEPLQAGHPDALPGDDEALDMNESSTHVESDVHVAPESDDDRSAANTPLDIGLLDLPVQFEIHSVALPLAQLAALRPGYVIELAAPVLDTPVRLVTHGQVVGYGEIVCVGDHLGVRITRMAYAGDSDR